MRVSDCPGSRDSTVSRKTYGQAVLEDSQAGTRDVSGSGLMSLFTCPVLRVYVGNFDCVCGRTVLVRSVVESKVELHRCPLWWCGFGVDCNRQKLSTSLGQTPTEKPSSHQIKVPVTLSPLDPRSGSKS